MREGRRALLAGAWFLALACGRTGLNGGNVSGGGEGGIAFEPPVDECQLDADCPSDDACTPGVCRFPDADHEVRYCVTRVVTCDDGDPCTMDRCDPDDGRCVHAGGGDEDHDGYRGLALEGMPTSCGGADCDDSDPRVFPGATESCDSKDNDCDGAIDEGASYTSQATPVLLAPGTFRSAAAGFAFDGTHYAVTYTETESSQRSKAYFALLGRDGSVAFGPSAVSEINADALAGTIATSGKAFFTSWADARQAGSYEIYGTRFDQQAQKLEADQRLSNAPWFSLRPSTSYTGDGYRVVWEDQRFAQTGGVVAVYGRKITLDGLADGDEVRLTGDDEDAGLPESDVSKTRLGVAYTVQGPLLPSGGDYQSTVRFRSFDLELGDDSGPVDIGVDGQEPSIVRTAEGFVVAWHTGYLGSGWGGAIQAAVLDERGGVLALGPITTGDAHARSRALVSLGDRVLVVWSAMPTASSPYQLFYEVISARDLSVESPRQPLVMSNSDLTEPSVELGPNGDVGVLFNDKTAYQAYFVPLACTVSSPTPR